MHLVLLIIILTLVVGCDIFVKELPLIEKFVEDIVEDEEEFYEEVER